MTKAELKAEEADVARRLAEVEELYHQAVRLRSDAMYLKQYWHDRIQQLDRAGFVKEVVGPLTRIVIN
jgi:hypothetical protein